MRIFIADDEFSVRSALCCAIEQEPDLIVVGEATRWSDTLKRLRAVQADVLLLDWELPGLAVLDVTRLPRPTAKIIVLSSRPEAQRAALAAGANAFVSKTDAPERLLDAIRSAAHGRAHKEPRVSPLA